MKAGKTKIVLAVWLTGLSAVFYHLGGWQAAAGIAMILGITSAFAFEAGRGDDAWKMH